MTYNDLCLKFTMTPTTITKVFNNVSDPRMNRTRRHPLINILTIGNVQDIFINIIPAPASLTMQHIYLYIATVIFAAGVGLYIGAGLGPGPRDGIMTGLSRLGISIRAARIGIDFTAFFIGLLMGGSYGYGTLVMVVTVGPIVQYTLNKFDRGTIYSL